MFNKLSFISTFVEKILQSSSQYPANNKIVESKDLQKLVQSKKENSFPAQIQRSLQSNKITPIHVNQQISCPKMSAKQNESICFDSSKNLSKSGKKDNKVMNESMVILNQTHEHHAPKIISTQAQIHILDSKFNHHPQPRQNSVNAKILVPSNTEQTQTSARDEPTKIIPASVSKKIELTLTEAEKTTFGDRFPNNYQRIELLGKGGFALVWLASSTNDPLHQKAIKQIINKNSNSDTIEREKLYYKTFFKGNQNELAISCLVSHPGTKNLLKVNEIIETAQDTFIVFELGGSSMSKCLLDMKGEFAKMERIYKVNHTNFYKNLQSSTTLFKILIIELLKGVDVLHHAGIVHSDLKPDNILLKLNPDESKIFELKIIDFGSVFHKSDWSQLQITTPEYLPPEILNNNEHKKMIAKYEQHHWALDIWSVGCIVLEILCGVPIWMNMKCRVERKKKVIDTIGLFGTKGRDSKKIIALQKSFCKDIKNKIQLWAFEWMDKDIFEDFLLGCINLCPSKRKTASELLSHPFLQMDNDYFSKL